MLRIWADPKNLITEHNYDLEEFNSFIQKIILDKDLNSYVLGGKCMSYLPSGILSVIEFRKDKYLSFYDGFFSYGSYFTWRDNNPFILVFFNHELQSVKILSDYDNSLKDVVKKRVAGGIFSSLTNNIKKRIVQNLKSGYTEDFDCSIVNTAESIYEKISLSIETVEKVEISNNNGLKDKLLEIVNLKKEGILTTEEYESKRNQII